MARRDRAGRPWQLQVFDVSLKKRQKLSMLAELLGPLSRERCLLVTKGDNPGSLNYHLAARGGAWTWCELDPDGIPGMEALLGQVVHPGQPDSLPFPDTAFDRVVIVDVHEHLASPDALDREVARVLAPGGLAVVTTPNGNERLPVAQLKRWLGMDPATYGHFVQGLTVDELEARMRRVGLVPERRGAYSRFFTEVIELGINFAWVKVLSRKKGGQRADGEIAPRNEAQLGAVGGAFRAYQALFPVVRAVSSLDRLLPRHLGYAVGVSARRPAS